MRILRRLGGASKGVCVSAGNGAVGAGDAGTRAGDDGNKHDTTLEECYFLDGGLCKS